LVKPDYFHILTETGFTLTTTTYPRCCAAGRHEEFISSPCNMHKVVHSWASQCLGLFEIDLLCVGRPSIIVYYKSTTCILLFNTTPILVLVFIPPFSPHQLNTFLMSIDPIRPFRQGRTSSKHTSQWFLAASQQSQR
jgi:hypothetical protein